MANENTKYFALPVTTAETLGGSKIAELDAINDAKIAELDRGISERKRQLEANRGSIVGKLNLDPDSTLGSAINTAAASVAGVYTALGYGVEAIGEGTALAQEALTGSSGNQTRQNAKTLVENLNQDNIVAYNNDRIKPSSVQRRLAGDSAISLTKGVIAVPEFAVGIADIVSGGLAGKKLEEAGFRPEEAKQFLDELKSTEQKYADANLGSADGFYETLATIAENPSVVPQTLLESLPSMLAGGLLGRGLKALGVGTTTAAAAGEGAVIAGAAAEGTRQQTEDGRLSLKQSLAAAGSGVFGAAVARATGGLSKKLGVGDIDEAVVDGTLGISKRAAATRAILGPALEGFEEAVQSAGEQVSSNFALDRSLTKGVGNAAALGAVTGAALASPLVLAETAKREKSETIRRQNADQAQAEAIKTGNVAPLVDPASPTYAPNKAVAALYGNSQLDTTTPEQKVANFTQASEIVAGLQAQADDLNAKLDESSLIDLKTLAPEEAKTIRANEAKLNRELQKTEKLLEAAQTSFSVFAQSQQNIDPETETNPSNLVTLSLTSPSSLTADKAISLAQDATNGLTEDERSYLRTFSEARQKENAAVDIDQVNSQIVNGSVGKNGARGNKGIVTYRENLASAITSNNQKLADRELTGFEKFRSGIVQKAEQVAAAQAQFANTNRPVQVIFDTKRGWVINQGKLLTPGETGSNGAVTITSKTPKSLLDGIKSSADVLNAAKNEFEAAYKLKFGQNQENTSVTDVPSQTSEISQEQPSTNSVPSTEAVGSTDSALNRTGVDLSTVQEASASSSTVTTSVNTESTASQVIEDNEPTDSSSIVAPTTTNTVNSVSEDTVVEGELAAARNKTGNTSYRKKTFGDLFVQSAGTENSSTKRPLVAARNFLSEKFDDLSQFVSETAFTNEQLEALRQFKTKATEWSKQIKANLAKGKNPDFYFLDRIQELVTDTNGELDIDENVKTAIAYSVFSWATESASSTLYKSDEDLIEELGREQNDATTLIAARAKLGKAGTRENVVINDLGQRIVDALGLKPDINAPLDAFPRLTISLGSHALKLLLDLGFVKTTIISGEEMAKLTGRENTDKNANFKFVRAVENNGELVQGIQEIQNAVKGSQAILSKLFKVESFLKEPTLQPVPYTQKTTKNTNQKVPSILAKILAAQNKAPWNIKQGHWAVLEKLSDTAVEAIAGVVTIDESKTHVVNRKSIEAKNGALRLEISRFKDYVAKLGDLSTPIFFQYVAWKPQRVGIATNVINPQTSKFHRFLVGKEGWTTKVDLNNEAQLENFYLRVGEGFGQKTDKAANADTLGNTLKLINSPVIQDAAEAIRRVIFEDVFNQADEATILAGVKAGKENTHSYDSLVALAQLKQAQLQGRTTFEVNLLAEVDGVTNGPILAHLLYGAASNVSELFGLVNRGGFFQSGSGSKFYNVWRGDKKNQDLYERTMLSVNNAVNQLTQTNAKLAPVLNAVYSFTGTLVNANGGVEKPGRNLVKNPVTTLVFGASINKMRENMGNNFVEAVYTGIESAATDPAKAQAVLSNLKTLGISGYTIKELINHEFTRLELNNLLGAFNNTLGDAVEVVMQSDFATFNMQRKQLVKATNITYELFNAALVGLKDQFLAELVSQGDIEVGKTGKPIHDLTQQQFIQLQNRLADAFPLLHTLFSKESGNLAAGLFIGKSGKNLTGNYNAEVKFGTPISGREVFSPKQNKFIPQTSIYANGYERTYENPGVSLAPMSIHSLDSYISHLAASAGNVLNIHDAHGAGLGNIADSARNLNATTFKALLNYSPLSEVHESLLRTITGLSKLASDGQLNAAALSNLKGVLEKYVASNKREDDTLTVDNALERLAQDIKQSAFHANSLKLQALSQLEYVDQYAFEGASYQVTDADRANAQSKLAELTNQLTQEETAAINGLVESLTKPAKQDSAEAVDPFINDGPLADTKVLGFTSVRAAQLVEVAVNDESLPEETRNLLQDVLDELVQKGKSLKQAVLTYAKGLEAAKLVELLSNRYNAIPENAWGTLGQSDVTSDPELVNFFETTNNLTAGKVIRELARKINAQPNSIRKEFNLKLLKVLAKTANPELSIRYVTPLTAPEMVLEGGLSKARGWYTLSNTSEEIYVLSPEHVHSGITVELLLHELTHSVLYKTVDNAQTGKADSEALKLVNELESLRNKATEYVKTNNLNKFGNATKNIHEFIAWGLTNADFQRTVLNNLSIASTTSNTKLVSGMKKFIDSIVGLLFRNSSKTEQEINSNGFAVFLANTSGLFAQAAQAKAARDAILGQEVDLVDNIQRYTNLQIHEALDEGKHNPEFDTKLRDLLTNLVDKLEGPFGTFLKQYEATAANTPLDAWLKALSTGVAPFATKIGASGIPVSQQEIFAIELVEATVRTALEDNEASTKLIYSQLSKLYDEVASTVQVQDFYDGDWSLASQNAKDIAQAQYDFVFKIEKGANNRSDYLSRFAALGLAHEKFNKILGFATKRKANTASKSIGDQIQAIFEKILAFFTNKIAKTYEGQPADEKLNQLASSLVDIAAKKKFAVARKQTNFFAPLEDLVRTGTETAKAKVVEFAKSDTIANSKNEFVKLAGTAVKIVGQDKTDAFVDTIQRLRNRHFKEVQGVASSLLTELKGHRESLQELLRLRKRHEGIRKGIITDVAKSLVLSFSENGRNFTKESKAAISSVFVRTGVHTLLGKFDLSQIDELISNKQKLDTAITDLENELASNSKMKPELLQMANGLGYYKATGRVAIEVLQQNAYSIARLFGHPYRSRVSEVEAKKTQPIIEKLITLYAIRYTDAAQLKSASETLRTELARTDSKNGVEFLLLRLKDLEKESLERLFGGNPALMTHGYTPEIYNPHTEIKVANEADGAALENQGYVKGAQVTNDIADPTAEVKNIYVLRDGGLRPWLSGIFSLTGIKSKGSKKHSGYVNTNTIGGLANAQLQASITTAKHQAIAKRARPVGNEDLSKVKGNFLAPVIDDRGNVVNYRYLMNEATKDNVLDRNNDFDKIVGTLAGSVYDKPVSREDNKVVIQALYDIAKDEYAQNPEAFKVISATSNDPELRQIWELLPQSTKEDVRAIWKTESLRVRVEELDLVFGYRKLSLANSFTKDPLTRGLIENFVVEFVEWLVQTYAKTSLGLSDLDAKDYSKRIAVNVSRAENIWQEIVKETKDIIVVKSGVVLLGNIISNFSLLYVKGVSLRSMIQDSLVALKGATAYRNDSAALANARALLSSGYTQGRDAEIERDIIRLEDALARNPVGKLMEAGLMPTIVEDVAADEDQYSYKSALTRKVQKVTDKLPKPVVAGGKFLYVAHDTKLYQALSRTTQLSDFIGRYALYQSLVTRQKNPLSEKDALQKASEAFVNYDIPMHRTLQFTDDLGLTPFTKYFFRIQKVLVETTKENPARVLSLAVANQFVNLPPIVLDSALIAHIGNNPLSAGAFNYPGVLDNLITVDTIDGILK